MIIGQATSQNWKKKKKKKKKKPKIVNGFFGFEEMSVKGIY
jgi:hypothetical protein